MTFVERERQVSAALACLLVIPRWFTGIGPGSRAICVLLGTVGLFGLACGNIVKDSREMESDFVKDVLLDSLKVEARMPLIYFPYCVFGTIFARC